jgi:hypothetical protein
MNDEDRQKYLSSLEESCKTEFGSNWENAFATYRLEFEVHELVKVFELQTGITVQRIERTNGAIMVLPPFPDNGEGDRVCAQCMHWEPLMSGATGDGECKKLRTLAQCPCHQTIESKEIERSFLESERDARTHKDFGCIYFERNHHR